MSESDEDLMRRAGTGDRQALGDLLERFRGRLKRMVDFRLDPRLRGRVDSSDVVQEASLQIARRFDEYLDDPSMSLYPWVRFITGQEIVASHRKHLGVRARDARREVRPGGPRVPFASSVATAAELIGGRTSPSLAFERRERRTLVERALEELDPIDREILVLRHLEQLDNAEAAEELGLEPGTASKRYRRALSRLQEKLTGPLGRPGDERP